MFVPAAVALVAALTGFSILRDDARRREWQPSERLVPVAVVGDFGGGSTPHGD